MSEVRLIDANALLKSLKSGCENCEDANTNWCEYCCKINDFEDLIDNAPTVDKGYDFGYADGHGEGYELGKNSRPQGEWKETGYETGALGITYRQTQCSNCGWEHALPMWLNFCPNCGAEMRRGDTE